MHVVGGAADSKRQHKDSGRVVSCSVTIHYTRQRGMYFVVKLRWTFFAAAKSMSTILNCDGAITRRVHVLLSDRPQHRFMSSTGSPTPSASTAKRSRSPRVA